MKTRIKADDAVAKTTVCAIDFLFGLFFVRETRVVVREDD